MMQREGKERGLVIHELPSVHCDERPVGVHVDTVIIHTMHNPLAEDRFSAVSCKECLDQYGVSAHYIIDREGGIFRTIPEEKRAWHAGKSKMPHAEDGRESVNAFSIGIELVGAEDLPLTPAQYSAVVALVKQIAERHPVRNILGHSDIAPERKTDPWNFDWGEFKKELASTLEISLIRFR